MFSLSPPSLSAAVVLNRHHGIYSCPKKRRKKRRKKNFQRRRYAALRLQWQVVKVKKKKKNQLTLKTWSWRKLPLALGRWRLKKLLHNLQQGSRPLCKRRPKLLWQRRLTLTVTFAGSSWGRSKLMLPRRKRKKKAACREGKKEGRERRKEAT